MPANSTSLPSTATSLRPPAGGLVRCRTQAPSATHSHRCAATPQHPEHDFADPLGARPLELEADVRRWINEWNAGPKPLPWTKTPDQVLDTPAAYCGRINDSRH
jgi:hypothetical protein